MKEKMLFIGLVDMNEIKGDSNHFRRLTSFMSTSFDLFIISFTEPVSDKQIKLNFPKVKVYRLLYWNIYLFFLILKVCKQNNIKKIYFREAGFVVSPYLVKFFLKVKLFVEINGVTADDLPISKSISTFLLKNFYKLSDNFIASKGYGSLINHNYKVPLAKIHNVSLGLEPMYLEGNLEQKFEIKTIIFIGNIVEYQGIEAFLEGFSLYLKSNDSVQFFIVGHGEYKEYLSEKVNKLGISNFVKFKNPLSPSGLHKLLLKCHLGISPFSNNRGIPNSISALKTYDYINAKLPILTSLMDEMAFFVEENAIGKVIYSYNPEEFAVKIKSCLDDTFANEAASIYQVNYDRWLDLFSWDTRFSSIQQVIIK